MCSPAASLTLALDILQIKMKTILLALILACTILAVPFLLDREDKFDIEDLQAELRSLKGRVAVLEYNAKHTENNANRAIRKVEEMVTTAYSHIIPVQGGLLAIKEEE